MDEYSIRLLGEFHALDSRIVRRVRRLQRNRRRRTCFLGRGSAVPLHEIDCGIARESRLRRKRITIVDETIQVHHWPLN